VSWRWDSLPKRNQGEEGEGIISQPGDRASAFFAVFPVFPKGCSDPRASPSGPLGVGADKSGNGRHNSEEAPPRRQRRSPGAPAGVHAREAPAQRGVCCRCLGGQSSGRSAGVAGSHVRAGRLAFGNEGLVRAGGRCPTSNRRLLRRAVERLPGRGRPCLLRDSFEGCGRGLR
jgi:hypothetical protein